MTSKAMGGNVPAASREVSRRRVMLTAAVFGAFTALVLLPFERHEATLTGRALTGWQLAGTVLLGALMVAAFVLVVGLVGKGGRDKDSVRKTSARHLGASVVEPPLSLHGLMGRRFLLVAAVLFAAWCVWIVPHMPGTMRDDTIAQMAQWYGMWGWFTQHPVFDTIVFGLFWSLGDVLGSKLIGLTIFIFVQAAATACALSLPICYARAVGAPRALCAALVVLCCAAPPVYQAVDGMSKDSLNAIFLVLALLPLAETARTDGRYLLSWPALLGTVGWGFLAVASRRTTLYILGLAWLVLLVRLLCRHAGRKALVATAVALVAPALLFEAVWTPVTNRILDVHDAGSQSLAALSLPGQQVIRTAVDHPERIDGQTKDLIASVVDYDKALELYNPTRSDEIFWYTPQDPRPANLVRAWLRLLPTSLDSYTDAAMDMVSGWFSLRQPILYGHNLHDELFASPGRLNWEASMFGGDQDKASAFFADFMALPGVETESDAATLEQQILGFEIHLPVLGVFASYGFWCFLVPMMSLGACVARRNGAGAVVSLVAFLILASYVAGPLVLYWYSVSSVMCAPLMLGAAPFASADRKPEA